MGSSRYKNCFAYASNVPLNRIDVDGTIDYIYTSQNSYYTENENIRWQVRFYAEIGGKRYRANSLETVTLTDWNAIDFGFETVTVNALVSKAEEEQPSLKKVT